MNRSTLPSILKITVMETIHSYPLDVHYAYTDGSAFKATLNAGYEALIINTDDNLRIIGPCR
jgi:hypothetical protein